RTHRYLAATFLAKAAYKLVVRGAGQAGVPVVGSTEGWQVDQSGGQPSANKVAEGAADEDARLHRHRLRR
ncbi:MAG TPA: hypothetical protein VLA80_04270, partial [Actinomycetota bacterium]|nr:hypothetical protein [Actinomycetota bacterium]